MHRRVNIVRFEKWNRTSHQYFQDAIQTLHISRQSYLLHISAKMNIKYVTSLSSFLWTYQYIKVNAEPSGNVSASAFNNPSNKRIKGLRTVKISVNQVPPTLFTPSVKLISKKSFSYPYLIPRYHPHYQGKFQLYKWQESGTRPSIKYLGAKYQVPGTIVSGM